jgi:hypothetical protein
MSTSCGWKREVDTREEDKLAKSVTVPEEESAWMLSRA